MLWPPARVQPLCISALFALVLAASAAVPDKPGYNRDIRPILSNNCFYCHGPDEKKREAKLRLDLREDALAEHDSGHAIVPGQPGESELLTRILSHDKDEVMPPPKAKKAPLTAEQIATLRRWIEQGAPYENHWAFLPLNSALPPVVRDRAWVRNSIDQYILARLESESIRPSPEADRATLIRRVSLDLLGLLPTPEEVAAFVADPAPDAYENARRPHSRQSTLRRALGPALARPGALRRLEWLLHRQPARHVAVSRLGDQVAQ